MMKNNFIKLSFIFFFTGLIVQVSAEERERNLDMLKFIGKETVRRGLLFQLGIWTLAYKWEKSADATYQIEGLTDATHASYYRDAMVSLKKLH